MNFQYFGDSYDIVKRFFIKNINEMGYSVFVDPMFTDNWNGFEEKFYALIGAFPLKSFSAVTGKTALFLDPDTGVNSKSSKKHIAIEKHITIEKMVGCLKEHDIVFSFDQAFSRDTTVRNKKISEKLCLLKKIGARGFYYKSHACFLFSAKTDEILTNLKNQFLIIGLPENRFVSIEE